MIDEKDYPSAYMMLSRTMRDSITYGTFFELLHSREIVAGKVLLRKGAEERKDYYLLISSDSEKIPWSAKYKVDGEKKTIFEEISVIKDGNEYKIRTYLFYLFFKETILEEDYGTKLKFSSEEIHAIQLEITKLQEKSKNIMDEILLGDLLICPIQSNDYMEKDKDMHMIKNIILKKNLIDRVAQTKLFALTNFKSLNPETLKYKGVINLEDTDLRKYFNKISFFQIKNSSLEFKNALFIIYKKDDQIVEVGLFKIDFKALKMKFILDKNQLLNILK